MLTVSMHGGVEFNNSAQIFTRLRKRIGLKENQRGFSQFKGFELRKFQNLQAKIGRSRSVGTKILPFEDSHGSQRPLLLFFSQL